MASSHRVPPSLAAPPRFPHFLHSFSQGLDLHALTNVCLSPTVPFSLFPAADLLPLRQDFYSKFVPFFFFAAPCALLAFLLRLTLSSLLVGHRHSFSAALACRYAP
jgi:hypothetical protein